MFWLADTKPCLLIEHPYAQESIESRLSICSLDGNMAKLILKDTEEASDDMSTSRLKKEDTLTEDTVGGVNMDKPLFDEKDQVN